MDPRTKRLLESAILPILLRLALPNILVMFVQASTGLIGDTYGALGTGAPVSLNLRPQINNLQTAMKTALARAMRSPV